VNTGPPRFVIEPRTREIVAIGETKRVVLPPVSDPDGDKFVVKFGPASSKGIVKVCRLTWNSTSLEFSAPQDPTLIGKEYAIELILKESCNIRPLFSSYIITLTIIGNENLVD
jgi:hypothetical protein